MRGSRGSIIQPTDEEELRALEKVLFAALLARVLKGNDFFLKKRFPFLRRCARSYRHNHHPPPPHNILKETVRGRQLASSGLTSKANTSFLPHLCRVPFPSLYLVWISKYCNEVKLDWIERHRQYYSSTPHDFFLCVFCRIALYCDFVFQLQSDELFIFFKSVCVCVARVAFLPVVD